MLPSKHASANENWTHTKTHSTLKESKEPLSGGEISYFVFFALIVLKRAGLQNEVAGIFMRAALFCAAPRTRLMRGIFNIAPAYLIIPL